MKRIAKIITTFFGVGFLPVMPGTWGALAGLLLYVIFLKTNPSLHYLSFLIVLILGFISSKNAQTLFGKKDPGVIVIDEVAGILLVFIFVPFSALNLIFGFFLFRLFDTLKPAPTGYFERLPGSCGIMLDDIIAAVYSNICLQVVNAVGRSLGLF